MRITIKSLLCIGFLILFTAYGGAVDCPIDISIYIPSDSTVSTTRPSEPTIADVGAKTISVTSRTSSTDVSACETLSANDTKYTLTTNITANATCLIIADNTDNITIDLAGYTITYNDSGTNAETYGITIGYNCDDIQIVNGTIAEGSTGTCDNDYDPGNDGGGGNDAGEGCNPIRTQGSVAGFEIGGITATWDSPDTGAFYIRATNGDIHHNTLTDSGTYINNRSQKPSVIDATFCTSGCEIYNNEIINARQVGIGTAGDTEVYNNDIIGLSVITNSIGIDAYTFDDVNIYNNKIVYTGSHAIGIFPGNAASIYGNYVHVTNTACNTEYGYPVGATALRMTWQNDDLLIYDNTFIAEGSDNSIADCGAGDAHARGLFVGLTDQVAGTINVDIYDNYIEGYNVDGDSNGSEGEYSGVAFRHNAPKLGGGGSGTPPILRVYRNTIVSNINIITLNDSYGDTQYPVYVMNNIFYKKGANSNFATISEYKTTGYARGYFIDNDCQNGADCEDIDLTFTSGTKEVFLGYNLHIIGATEGNSVTIVDNDTDAIPQGGAGNIESGGTWDGYIIEKAFSSVDGTGPTYEVSETQNSVTIQNCDAVAITVDGNKQLGEGASITGISIN